MEDGESTLKKFKSFYRVCYMFLSQQQQQQKMTKSFVKNYSCLTLIVFPYKIGNKSCKAESKTCEILVFMRASLPCSHVQILPQSNMAFTSLLYDKVWPVAGSRKKYD